MYFKISKHLRHTPGSLIHASLKDFSLKVLGLLTLAEYFLAKLLTGRLNHLP